MVRTGIRKYSYTILLAGSLLLAASARRAGYVRMENRELILDLPGLEELAPGGREEGRALAGIYPRTAQLLPSVGSETKDEERVTETVLRPVRRRADISWFDDALFIGDSRTVGLHEYGNLGNAEVLADSGMSVYKLFKKSFTLSSGEEGTLEELLSGRKFGKIYLMLGINELGYDFERTVSRYEDAVERIQALQPDALVFLQANLHIAKEKSESSPIYNNENIDRFNEAVGALADGRTRFYLDVNELFDDGEGNLSGEYTVDQAHVLGKYYVGWADWILENTVVFESVARAGEQ